MKIRCSFIKAHHGTRCAADAEAAALRAYLLHFGLEGTLLTGAVSVHWSEAENRTARRYCRNKEVSPGTLVHWSGPLDGMLANIADSQRSA